ncbi:MAG TPA: cytochrome c oxidase subunit 3 [Cyclobacteriaceae bacterium]|nr:cytochrome c oxidase subunit 3 [Cyclobacteriaceae bacterium]HMV10617.1 cytochrome c oxidase subunit 3 [Cyclobacteriaceae bacterium]HMV91011.1 cytochrome c oxidase subunit 3 [Cyclobacteriaceae bacterium]HMX02604.1 cytochrome c oxidase subunit 3 [Cyclobacteriaceae bacterium]HMX50897.1 cytochrome c oxidase subunit 3 [Cyclobacteriaceae bacterium]
MSVDIKIVEEPKQPMTMNPKKFGMWLFMVTVFMVFAALSSAYIVRRAEGNWSYFELPALFWVNTVVILISSITLQWAYVSAKRDNLESVKIATIITAILGIGFMVGQYFAWADLVTNSIHLVGNPSGSFVYIISGLHGAHVLGGVIYLLILLSATQKGLVHSKSLNRIEMCATYWHFLGGLWLYLFLFLLLYR